MATAAYTLTGEWASGARYTAAADVDIFAANTSLSFPLAWATTTGDTAPTVTPAQASKILPGEGIGMQLLSGDRLWFASTSGQGSAAVET
jgi:hypothetical protein